MRVAAYEGIVEKGCVQLPGEIRLADGTRVYVIVPQVLKTSDLPARIYSPRLVNPKQSVDFEMTVTVEKNNV